MNSYKYGLKTNRVFIYWLLTNDFKGSAMASTSEKPVSVN